MNYNSIIKCSTSDFVGVSVVLQVTGCSHGCKGCWASSVANPKTGQPFTEDAYQYLVECLSKPYITNLVLQGGDPLFKMNYKYVIKLCERIKNEIQDKNIVLFTGYELQQIQDDPERCQILPCIDYLVDGKFDITQKVRGQFFGSSNQRIYRIKDGVATLDENLN